MSIDKFTQKMATRTAEVAAAEAAKPNPEKARRPFHDSFREEIYPLWGTPLKQVSSVPGVAQVLQTPGAAPPPADNLNELLAKVSAGTPPIGADILVVQLGQGVNATVVYAYFGDSRTGKVCRYLQNRVSGEINGKIDLDTALVLSGDLTVIEPKLASDVPAAFQLLGELLARTVDEQAAAEKAIEEQARKTRIDTAVARLEEAKRRHQANTSQASTVSKTVEASKQELEEATKAVQAARAAAGLPATPTA